MDGSTTSSRNHSRNALRHGECSVLHSQSRPRPAEAHRERHVGRGHGEKGQEARRAGVCPYPEVDCLFRNLCEWNLEKQ
ncbi:uncharacterized protein LOC126620073 [Malus sylvestris]|uniref:uncharacterized protein LOC126620073 n=1 Tax=Malus sylvestris TaxID=3752 RepID=UPI0021AD034B|nr:uncharacterized protein LOC126620073 [Malus sylvestris]